MNKKVLLILLIPVLVFILWGYSKKDQRISADNGENSKIQVINIDDINSADKPSKANGALSSKKNYGKLGFDIRDEELKYILKNFMDDASVMKLLGEPDKKTGPEFWGSDGLKRETWYYSLLGIQLKFVRSIENKISLESVCLTAPCKLITSRGIGIGSTREEVLSKYNFEIDRTEINYDPSKIVAGTIYGGIIFSLSGDKVTSIFIGSYAE